MDRARRRRRRQPHERAAHHRRAVQGPAAGKHRERSSRRAGLQLVKPRGARDYRGAIADLPGVEVAYLSAGEIADALAQGSVHLGITGEDLLRESIADIDKRVVMIEGLGFGFANVVVAVPQAWIDVRSMADLDDVATAFRLRHDRKMRVATKYVNLTRDFFSSFGIVDYRIVESSGATEGAPAAGSAELIVDITTTGATLAANGLKIVDDGIILRSQANLVAARGAAWGEAERETARHILDRIAAQAQGTRLPRGANALPRLRRGDAGRGEEALRRGGAVRRADLVRHADAALSAAGDLRSRELHARARRAEHHRRRDRIRVRAGQSALRTVDCRALGFYGAAPQASGPAPGFFRRSTTRFPTAV